MVKSFKGNILKKSNSYNYYKSEYIRLKNEKELSKNFNNNLNEINRALEDIKGEITSISNLNDRINFVSNRLERLDKFVSDKFDELDNCLNTDLKELLYLIIEDIKKQQEYINNLNSEMVYSQNLLKEIQYSRVFADSITKSEWLSDKSFSLINSAANYSFFYVLYRILNEVKPQNILELGLGQTTKMTTQYVSYFNESNLQVIEDNQEWIDKFSKCLSLSDNVKINQVNSINVLIDYNECLKYENFDRLLNNNLFDLVIIDGPLGYGQMYPRTNIWDIVNYLNNSFVIIIDDYDRKGEQNTCKKLFEILSKKGIDFDQITFKGLKHQLVIYSPDNKFVSWF